MSRRLRKSRPFFLIEYVLVRLLMALVSALPHGLARAISSGLGNVVYAASNKRRGIAVQNIRAAMGNRLDEGGIRQLARRSCASFILTYMEIIKFRTISKQKEAIKDPRYTNEEIFSLFEKAKALHDSTGGCIFATPHLGNWELLTHVSAAVGIPLVVVARPPDNPYLRHLLLEDRTSSGQVIVPKKNALYALRRALRRGKSLGLLPDQSTKHGLAVPFFGRSALTTPIPAMLAITYNRPLVVVACCRSGRDRPMFEGFVSEPIWPGEYESERAEILRLTTQMNRTMEEVILKYPEQYLWMHNRWKTYDDKREFLA